MAELKIQADSGGGTVSFKGPATTTLNAAVQLTLPVDDGTADQFLKTNGSGALSWAAAGSPSIDDNGDATAITIDSSERVGIGTTDPGTRRVKIEHTTDTPLQLHSTQSNCYMQLGNSSATNGYLGFETTNLTFHNNGKKAEIDTSGNLKVNAGNLVIGTSGKGIDFSATADGGGSATNSELFDDYEEGTWTPVVQGSSVTQYNQTGWYTKIGNIVHFGVYVTVSGGTANNEIHGLPYSVSSGEIYNVFSNWSYAWWDWQLTHDAGPLVVWAQAGGSILKLKQTDWNGQAGMPDVNFGGGNTTTNLYGTGFYRHG